MSWAEVVFFCFYINLKNDKWNETIDLLFWLSHILTRTFQNFRSGQTACLSSSPESLLFLTFSVMLRRPQERPAPHFTTPQKAGAEKKHAHSSLTHVFPLSITTETIRVPINLPFWGKAPRIGSCRDVPAQQPSTAYGNWNYKYVNASLFPWTLSQTCLL